MIIASVALLTAGFILTVLGLTGAWLSARQALARQREVAVSSRSVGAFFDSGYERVVSAAGSDAGGAIYTAMREIETDVRTATHLPDTTMSAFDPTGEGAKVAALRTAFESITWDLIWLGTGIVLTFVGSMLAFSV